MLLDTNVVSELARPRPDPSVVAYLGQVSRGYLSAMTLHELHYGALRMTDSVRQKKLSLWLDALQAKFQRSILPVTVEIAERSAQMRAEAERSGRVLHVEDSFIAATAAVHGLTLVTRNTKDFEFTGIALVNPWGE